MTIDKEKLVELLVEKTGMDRADIDAQLNELTERIKKAAARGKALEIKGFGLFYFDEDGDLKFDPSNQLDTEINQKYTGMESVELKPPRDSSKTEPDEARPGEEEPDEEHEKEKVEDDVFGIGKTLSGEEEGETGDAEESKADPFEKLFKKSSDAEQQEEGKIRKSGTKPSGKEPVKEKAGTKTSEKQSRDPMVMIILIVLAIVGVAIGYLLLNNYFQAPEQQETSEQSMPVESPPTEAEQDITEPEEPEPMEQVQATELPEETESAPEDTESETENQNGYGLYGDFDAEYANGYTIVVHSLRGQQHAENTADGLKEEGYRISVTESTVDGRTVFRVGVGQFPNVEDALQAADELPQPYKNRNFIKRIQ